MNLAARALRLVVVVLSISAAAAAPLVVRVGFRAPSHAQPGELVVISGFGLVAPLQVYFSDGTNPTVLANALTVDPVRGMATVRVPAGAKTGNLKVNAGGVDSNLFAFRVDSGTFTPGTDVLSGTVTSGGTPVPNAAVILLKAAACQNQDVYGVAMTDGSGHYAITTSPGTYSAFVWPATDSGLASNSAQLTLASGGSVQNLTLEAGTLLSGTVVDAGTSAPIANAVVSLEGNVYDQRITDASGNFAFHSMPGDYDYSITTPPGDTHTAARGNVTVVSPGPQPVGNQALTPGPAITGTVLTAGSAMPLPGARVRARVSGTWDGPQYEADVLGDGSYTLGVLANASYDLEVDFERDSQWVDGSAHAIAVGTSNVTKNWSMDKAARITGTVRDAGTNLPLDRYDLTARDPATGNALYFAQTCEDGIYTFRVVPGATNYVVQAGTGNETGYAFTTWNNTVNGTSFWCEGQRITAATNTTVVSGVDFKLVAEAVIDGAFYTTASSCTTVTGSQPVSIDDGLNHPCSLGQFDWTTGSGHYRAYGLPPSTVLPSLRVCTYPNGLAPQCWNRHAPPSYSSLIVSPGTVASGIDFCLSSQPTREITRLDVRRVMGGTELQWTASTDPLHHHYNVRASTTARPTGAPSFPTNPPFNLQGTTLSTTWTIPGQNALTFFLVTDVGMYDEEGPAGAYGH